jgi:hypothetical protein
MSNSYIQWAETRVVFENEKSRVLDSVGLNLNHSGRNPCLDYVKHFNDVTVAPESHFVLPANADIVNIIIPLVGGLEIIYDKSSFFLEPSQYLITKINSDEPLKILNPYDSEHVNFIEIDFAKK